VRAADNINFFEKNQTTQKLTSEIPGKNTNRLLKWRTKGIITR